MNILSKELPQQKSKSQAKKILYCKFVDQSTSTMCDYKTRDSANMTIHRRKHTGLKPYECVICGKKFSIVGNKNDHLRRHQKLKPYKCPINGCTKSYYRRYELINHGKHLVHSDILFENFEKLVQ